MVGSILYRHHFRIHPGWKWNWHLGCNLTIAWNSLHFWLVFNSVPSAKWYRTVAIWPMNKQTKNWCWQFHRTKRNNHFHRGIGFISDTRKSPQLLIGMEIDGEHVSHSVRPFTTISTIAYWFLFFALLCANRTGISQFDLHVGSSFISPISLLPSWP